MPNSANSKFVITGPEADLSTVPADAIVRLLGGFQQLALLFAAHKENRPLSLRFKAPSDLKRKYSLRCGPPSSGSYILPVELVDESSQQSLFPPEKLMDEIKSFIHAVSVGDREKAVGILPDSRYRERALREIRTFAPRQGEGWTASLVAGSSPAVSLNGRLSRNIDEWLEVDLTERLLMTVTGELIRINFDENKLFIRVPVTARQLECSYLPETEVDLLESRRGLVQVTGEFVIDETGQPLRLTAVSRIEPVDLSPLVFLRLEYEGRVLEPKLPLEITPSLDEQTQQFYVASDDSLDLHAFAETRDGLAEEIAQQVVFAWIAYVDEERDRLAPKAAELADSLRQRFVEVKHAKR
jgi:hypothetical protein